MNPVDVLCIGHASYDLTFSVRAHPGPDTKEVATDLVTSGGGPAANAAVAVCRLGGRSAFAGYLSRDPFGEQHLRELVAEGVDTSLVWRGKARGALSSVLVKPDGRRSLVNQRSDAPALSREAVDLSGVEPRVLLVDGHEPDLSEAAIARFRPAGVRVILDAGSVHAGTQRLLRLVDYIVASERFSREYIGSSDPALAVRELGELAPGAVVTAGERGLWWHREGLSGFHAAIPVRALDTTGAGDAFHGAFALAVARGYSWEQVLTFSSAAGALACTRLGARPSLPTGQEVDTLLAEHATPSTRIIDP